jgi:hypothetical protein
MRTGERFVPSQMPYIGDLGCFQSEQEPTSAPGTSISHAAGSIFQRSLRGAEVDTLQITTYGMD